MFCRTISLGLLAVLACPTGAFEIQHWTTAQGTRIGYVHSPELPMLDLAVMFDAGSARDGKDHGIASITGSMLEQGAGGLSADEIAARLDAVGAEFGAGVSKDTTRVSLRSLSDSKYLEPALETFITILTEADFSDQALQRLINQKLTNIKKRAQRPGKLASIAFNRALYGDHPYAHPVNGEEETVRVMTTQKLRAFYRRYFTAQNAVITLVGDISRADAERIAAQISAALPRGSKAPPLPPVAPNKPQNIHIPFDSTQAHVYIGQIGMRLNDRDYFPLYLANHAFGGSGFGSRLLDEVRKKRGYVYSIWSYFVSQRESGAFAINFQTQTDQASDAKELVIGMVKDWYEQGVSREELALSKDSVRGGFPLRIGNNRSIASWVGRITFFDFSYDYLDTYIDRIEQVTPAMITDAIRRRIDPAKLVIVTVGG